MVLPYGSLSAVVFPHLSGDILVDTLLSKCMFSPESNIARLVLKVQLGGVSIL